MLQFYNVLSHSLETSRLETTIWDTWGQSVPMLQLSRRLEFSQRDSGLANLIIESSPLHRQLDELLSEESARYAALVSETKYLLNSCRAMEHASDLANLRIEPSPTAQTIR